MSPLVVAVALPAIESDIVRIPRYVSVVWRKYGGEDEKKRLG